MFLINISTVLITAIVFKSLTTERLELKILEKLAMDKKKQLTQSRSSYKTSEKVEKTPSENHPCNLTRTTMRISFPALRSELFVNILGYREPNLVSLWQCKGRYGAAGSHVGCVPIVMKQKKVNMMLKTNSFGRDSKEHSRELILDEHVECGFK